jgi:hypothetical protein
MADHQNKTIQVLGAELLEKAIVGEFHAFKIMVNRLERSGIVRSNGGKARNSADGKE